MGAPGVYVYLCPDGIHKSLYPDLRDCPGVSPGETGLAGGGSLTRKRFLGARGRLVSAEEAALLTLRETAAPEALDLKKLLAIGFYAFVAVAILIILTRRRKRAVRHTR